MEKMDKITNTIEALSKANGQQVNLSVSINVNQHYIITTEDKVKLVLNGYESAKKYTDNLVTFLSLSISLLIPVFNSDFKSFLCFKAELVQAFYFLIFVTCCVMFFISLIKKLKYGKKISITYVTSEICKEKCT